MSQTRRNASVKSILAGNADSDGSANDAGLAEDSDEENSEDGSDALSPKEVSRHFC